MRRMLGDHLQATVESQRLPVSQSSKMALLHPVSRMAIGGRLSVAVVLEACESVIDAEEEVPAYAIKDARATKIGRIYASATCEERNAHHVRLGHLSVDEGEHHEEHERPSHDLRKTTFDMRTCEAGHAVVFDQECSVVFTEETCDINDVREEGKQLS